MIRLDKYLADMGIGTRSAVKQMIRKGQVQVNQETAARPELKIDEQNDKVQVNGQTIGYAAFEYYMLHKPAGVVSATEDKRDKTVIDLIESRKRKDLFPVGRLDKDTEGLLLITNDGALAHQLLAPKKHVDKVYYAKVHGINQCSIHIKQHGICIFHNLFVFIHKFSSSFVVSSRYSPGFNVSSNTRLPIDSRFR